MRRRSSLQLVREAESSFVGVEHRQAALATLMTSVVTARLEVVRADALAVAAGATATSPTCSRDCGST